MNAKKRIVILGGGVGGVTTAFELSRPGWEQHFGSITLYQQGWRLGGKGASGRGTSERIEEHGLHIWFGFYENAFRMLRQCHEELDERARHGDERWPLAFTTMKDSFRRVNEICLTDHDGCCWKLWVADFFDFDNDRPWAKQDLRSSARPENWSVLFYLVRCLRLAADLAWSLTRSEQRLEMVSSPVPVAHEGYAGPEDFISTPWAWLTAGIREALDGAAEMLDSVAEEMLEQPIVDDVFELMLRALDRVADFLRQRYDELVRSNDAVRRAWYVVDLLVAIARGIFEDDLHKAGTFDVIDDQDFRDWLRAHGADPDTVDCALVRTVVYDLAFGYEGGNPGLPACGAGTALRGLLRTFFTYRGSLMWKMNAGMGDVVFAPLYELLAKRGVKVQFFHRVEKVHAADGMVTQIDIDRQAAVPEDIVPSDFLRPEREKENEEDEKLPWKAVWPASPWQLPGGKAWAPEPAAFYESWYRGREAALVDEIELYSDGAGDDGFDVVVFAMPISCVRDVAPDLLSQSDLWRKAVDRIQTVPTQAMQLWLNRPASKLGALDGVVLGGFVEPYDTWADMPHLVDQEDVKGSETVAYFCNVMKDVSPPDRGDADEWLDRQDRLVKEHALRFIDRDLGKLWPEAVDRQTRKFDWDALVAAGGKKGRQRLDDQYLRANVEPSERYVLSVPGSSGSRIKPDDTGFQNLYAAGDWTSCVLNAGCVEAAVISGIRAANGIHRNHGNAAYAKPIVGEESP